MRLFWKIFAAVFISFVIVISLISYIEADRSISYREKHLIKEQKLLGNIVSKEIEVSYKEAKWPFETLEKVSECNNFLFWWIVRDDNTIHLADNADFMGTYAYDYFPELNVLSEEYLYLDKEQNYGIYIETLETGANKWSFWLGFSTAEISKIKNEIIFWSIVSSLIALLVLGTMLFFIVRHITKPIKELSECAQRIKKGDLDAECKVKTKDEVGELGKTFEEMRLGLKDRNQLLDTLLATFRGKFGNIAGILFRKNVQELAKRNPRILKIVPRSIRKTIKKKK